MYAMIGTLTKPTEMTTEEFRRWWIDEHVPHVKAIPGLLHYLICPADSTFDPASGAFSQPAQYDGIAILVFDSEQAMRDVFASSTAADADRAHLVDRGLTTVTVAGEPLLQIGTAFGLQRVD